MNVILRLVSLLVMISILVSACKPQATKETPELTSTLVRPTATDAGIDTVDDGAPLPPEILVQIPEPGQELALNGEISISFNQPMEKNSTSAAWEMTGLDDLAVDGDIVWPDDRTMTFTPKSPLNPGTSYQVVISTEAKSSLGVNLNEPVQMGYFTIGELQVSQVFPAEGTKEVANDSVITVIFNRPVVPLVVTEDKSSLPQPLTISPPVEGTGEWVNTSIYTFQPERSLKGETTYQITVKAGLEDATGESYLGEDYTWGFTTNAPGIESFELGSGVVNPEDHYRNLLLDEYFRVNFLQPMDQHATEGAISLADDQESLVDLITAWNQDLTQVVITPTELLALGTNYTLNIDQNALSSDGVGLKSGLSWNFTTIPVPGILNFTPANNTVQQGYSSELRIQFASPMNIQSVKERISISPAPDKEIEWWYQDWDYSIAGYFLQPSTRYEVNIQPGMEDIYGNKITQGSTLRFTTAAYYPSAYLQMPYEPILMRTDGPQEFYANYLNVQSVSFKVFEISPQQMVSFMTGGLSSYDYVPPESSLVWQTAQKSQAGLNETALKAFTPVIDGDQPLPAGFYFLGMDAAGVQKYNHWVDQRLLIVANTNLTFKSTSTESLVWATDLTSGKPLQGVGVGIYDKEMGLLADGITDQDGLLVLETPEPEDPYSSLFAITSNGEVFGFVSSQGDSGIDTYQYGIYGGYYAPANQPTAYIYTERPIYRPGQPVYFKGILRQDDDLDYSIPDVQQVKMKITSFEETVYEQDLQISDLGTFDGEFNLDAEAALGYYSLEVLYPEKESSIGSVGFTVAEYRRPEFKVSVASSPTNVLAGEDFTSSVQAEYYSGGAVSGAAVAWTLTSERFNFTPPDEYSSYSFSDIAVDEYSFEGEADLESQVIAQGEGKMDASGHFSVTLPADLSDVKTSRTLIFEATVTDLSNNSVSGRSQVVGHRSEIYPGTKPQEYVGEAGKEQVFEFIALDWDGETVANQQLEIEIVERRWHSVQEQDPSGRIQWKSTVEEIPIIQFTDIKTNTDGEAQAAFTPPNGGIFRARVSTLDRKANLSSASAYMWVADEDYIPWQQTNDRSFDLVTDRKKYSPGDTAEILIASPFQGDAYALVTVERGSIHYEDVIKLTKNSTIYQLPLAESMAPNVFISVLVIKGVDETNPRPNFKMGIVEIEVDRKQKEITVELEANPPRASSGETVTYTVTTKDYRGDPVKSEVSLGLSDLATLSLLPPNSIPIMDHFYSKRTLGVWTVVPIDASIEEYNALLTDEIMPEGGRGGGGGAKGVGDLGVMEVRQDFPDTAFWEAYVQTNENGKATVKVTLPDSLTTWRMDARAVNVDTLVGQSTQDLISTKSLFLRPQTPRFFVAGDQVTLGAAIHNNTDNSLQVEAQLEAEGLELLSSANQSVEVPANAQAYVTWQTKVKTDANRVDLLFSAEGGGFSDKTRPTVGILDNQGIPVYRYSAPEVVGTSGQILEAGTRVEAISLPPNLDTSQGELTIRINPSLAASLTDGLTYLEDFPYACIEQTISAFLPNVISIRALQDAGQSDPLLEHNLDQTVETSLQKLYNWQNADGGWGWWQNNRSDALTSAYVLLGLVEAKKSGYSISETVLSTGLSYLTRQLKPVIRLTRPELLNRQAFLLYVLARAEKPAVSHTVQIYDQRQNLAVYALAYLTQTLAWIDNQDPRLDNLLSEINTAAITSATGAHWEEKNVDRWNWNTDTRTTAIVLSVISQLDPENPLSANAVRWLINHRLEGHWRGTQETAWTLMGLANWMRSSGELEANYLFGVTVNGDRIGGGQANSDNLRQTSLFVVEIVDLLKDQLNRLAIARDAGPGNLYYSAHLNVFLPVQEITPLSQGVTISRSYYHVDDISKPIQEAGQGDLILGRLTVVVPNDVHYLVINDPFPAGLEAIDQSLSTSPQSLEIPQAYRQEDLFWRGWGWWNFNHIEYRDEKLVLSSDYLPAGTYIFTYLLRAFSAGEYNVIPPTANEFYFPEVYGRGSGSLFTVNKK